jgi:L-serine dehydratase
MAEKSSIFDMIGPVMIGPSSSHTAGVVKIGNMGYRILGEMPKQATVVFYNSFARTYEGHGSDKAIVAGLMGFATDDARIKQAFELAKDAGFSYAFRPIGNASIYHPNTVRLQLEGQSGRKVEVVGVSRGGGVIGIVEVDGFGANFTGNLHTLIIHADDRKGSISFIASVLSNDDCNIANMMVSRKGKHQTACHFIEMDSGVRDITLQYLRSLGWIRQVTYIPGAESEEASA